MKECIFDLYMREKLRAKIDIPRIVKIRIYETFSLIQTKKKYWSKKGLLTIGFFMILVTIGIFNFLYSAYSREISSIPIIGPVFEYIEEYVVGDGTVKTIYHDGTTIYRFKHAKYKTYKDTSIIINEVRLTEYSTLIGMNITFPENLVYEFELIDNSGNKLGTSPVSGGIKESKDSKKQSRALYLDFERIPEDAVCVTIRPRSVNEASSSVPMNESDILAGDPDTVNKLSFDIYLK